VRLEKKKANEIVERSRVNKGEEKRKGREQMRERDG